MGFSSDVAAMVDRCDDEDFDDEDGGSMAVAVVVGG